jgi:hypothetical protein
MAAAPGKRRKALGIALVITLACVAAEAVVPTAAEASPANAGTVSTSVTTSGVTIDANCSYFYTNDGVAPVGNVGVGPEFTGTAQVTSTALPIFISITPAIEPLTHVDCELIPNIAPAFPSTESADDPGYVAQTGIGTSAWDPSYGYKLCVSAWFVDGPNSATAPTHCGPA